MVKVGEIVKWREPLDADYSYGTLLGIKRGFAVIKCSGYYAGMVIETPIKYVRKGGKGVGSSKKHRKRFVT